MPNIPKNKRARITGAIIIIKKQRFVQLARELREKYFYCLINYCYDSKILQPGEITKDKKVYCFDFKDLERVLNKKK